MKLENDDRQPQNCDTDLSLDDTYSEQSESKQMEIESKQDGKKKSWLHNIKKNRPVVIMIIMGIMFMIIFVYLYIKGNIFLK